MNGCNPARRRPTAPTSSPFGNFIDRAYGSNDNAANGANVQHVSGRDDGGQGKSRRKRSTMCSVLRQRIGRLRWIDALLIVGCGAKLAHMLYHHEQQSLQMKHTTSSTTIGALHKQFSSSDPLPTGRITSPWIEIWKQQKMPFNPPLLYRLNEHVPDEYRGMIRGKNISDKKKRELDTRSFAVVDDAVFHADESRERTHWALHESEIKPQIYEYDDEEIAHLSDCPHSIYLKNLKKSVDANDSEDEEKEEVIKLNQYIDDSGEWDAYYAFDDDFIRNKGTGLHEKRPPDSKEGKNELCIRPKFYNQYYPTCNEIHSLVSGGQWMIGDDSLVRNWGNNPMNADVPLSKYLGSGYYRNAFLLQRPFVETKQKTPEGTGASIEWDEVVFKSMKQLSDKSYFGVIADDDEVRRSGWGYDPSDTYTYMELMEDMRKDAMVMELLTSSPRSANIYSYCALSSVIEFAPIDIEDYIMPSGGHRPKPVMRHGSDGSYAPLGLAVNDHIPPHEKLEIALEMAKCISTMHGFENGPIVHVDVQAGQFFRGRDGLIKLVDYNRAEALLYDVKQDKYCNWINGPPAEGMFRAPEENIDAPLTEKIDVYSLGNVFYSVLTGIMVFNNVSSEEAHRRIVEGETEPIADFYYNEPNLAALAEAIEMCWTYDVEERPSIFEVVQFLEQAVKVNKR